MTYSIMDRRLLFIKKFKGRAPEDTLLDFAIIMF